MLFTLVPAWSGAQDLPDLPEAVQPFFEEHCLGCHGAKKQKGEFRIDQLMRDFTELSTAERWHEVMIRLNAGEMPPEDEVQPGADDVTEVAAWISGRLQEGRAARMAKRGPVVLYRLSREEYAHTVYDLLGVHYDPTLPGRFNEDPRWHGFDRLGSMLTLSPSHITRYLSAADTVVSQAFSGQDPPSKTERAEANDGKAQEWLSNNDMDGPVRWLLYPGRRQGQVRASAPGLYRIRIQLSALPSFKGRLPHLSLWNGTLKQSVVGLDVFAPEDAPTVVELETFLPAGSYDLMNETPGLPDGGRNLSETQVPFVSTQDKRFIKPTGYKLYDEEGRPIFPLLIVDWVEWEGPILPVVDREKRADLYPAKEDDPAEVRAALTRFAERAWRRPASAVEIERFMDILSRERAAEEAFRPAYQAALTGVLTAKNFYYLSEGSAAEDRELVNDWELASRLSYFLWNSMPDEELFALAREGSLHQPDVLRRQVTRMLTDSRINRFVESFPQQWLQLHRVGMFPPDAELYPDYDKWLEKSMVLESTRFFGEVFERNLPLHSFLTSDWTMMNARLAMHYQMPLLESTSFQRVVLRPEDHRGGLLTHASVLSLTSDGTRHRPVHRGVWVSEAIFGKTPPPPPPNVEPLEPTPSDEPKATIRMKLEAHATHALCASCHRKIDPLGFAFEPYDAIGRWRTHEQDPSGQGEDPPVDASGVFPDGRAYEGPEAFKQILVKDIDRFAEAFVEQLATYALRRVMTLDDREALTEIAAGCKSSDYPLREVIESVVLSDLFRQR